MTTFVARGLSLLGLLAAWTICATFVSARTLPAPQTVLAFVLHEAAHGDLGYNIGMTFWRVAASYGLAMAFGTMMGVLLGRNRKADMVFDTLVLVLLNVPALVLTILCYIWLGLTETAAITAVALNKLPSVIVIVREGARSIDNDLEDMSRTFRLPATTWLRHILLPQLAPYVAAASRSGLALVWKIVLVVELLGRPNGVGYAISIYFQLFDMRGVLGYSVSFMSVMLAVEFLVLKPLENHVRRWRRAPG